VKAGRLGQPNVQLQMEDRRLSVTALVQAFEKHIVGHRILSHKLASAVRKK
jgi:hypothetical protein